jgi:hypothetical protein
VRGREAQLPGEVRAVENVVFYELCDDAGKMGAKLAEYKVGVMGRDAKTILKATI